MHFLQLRREKGHHGQVRADGGDLLQKPHSKILTGGAIGKLLKRMRVAYTSLKEMAVCVSKQGKERKAKMREKRGGAS